MLSISWLLVKEFFTSLLPSAKMLWSVSTILEQHAANDFRCETGLTGVHGNVSWAQAASVRSVGAITPTSNTVDAECAWACCAQTEASSSIDVLVSRTDQRVATNISVPRLACEPTIIASTVPDRLDVVISDRWQPGHLSYTHCLRDGQPEPRCWVPSSVCS